MCDGCDLPRIEAICAVIAGKVACCPDCSTLTVEERNRIRAALPAFDDAKGIEAAAKALQSSLSSVYGVDANVIGIDEAREDARAIIAAYKGAL